MTDFYATAFLGLYFAGQDETKAARRELAAAAGAGVMFAQQMDEFARKLMFLDFLDRLKEAA